MNFFNKVGLVELLNKMAHFINCVRFELKSVIC
jgi:hypothetical protein